MANFHEKMKENVNKNLDSSSLKIFFLGKREFPSKTSKNNQRKKKGNKNFCKTLDIFWKRDKIIVVGRIKSLSNKNKIL
ncbi:hypothetical protein [Streptococcus oralis]|uniref:hypothetical protein n=1 Tax=Streptococcus oralis TaxID=1303 RepID=UPI00163A2905|nr:hypothetical protein [Streptococcus oralis]